MNGMNYQSERQSPGKVLGNKSKNVMPAKVNPPAQTYQSE